MHQLLSPFTIHMYDRICSNFHPPFSCCYSIVLVSPMGIIRSGNHNCVGFGCYVIFHIVTLRSTIGAQMVTGVSIPSIYHRCSVISSGVIVYCIPIER